jgi:hypothetical protein
LLPVIFTAVLRISLANNPRQQQLAGVLAFFELGSNMDDAESILAGD